MKITTYTRFLIRLTAEASLRHPFFFVSFGHPMTNPSDPCSPFCRQESSFCPVPIVCHDIRTSSRWGRRSPFPFSSYTGIHATRDWSAGGEDKDVSVSSWRRTSWAVTDQNFDKFKSRGRPITRMLRMEVTKTLSCTLCYCYQVKFDTC